MAEITAAMVKQLRDKTGAGMMECKAALTEANGNMDEAITLLRKRGLAQAAKRAGRATAQGMIGSYIHMGGKIGVLVEVNCESDFVARTDDFNNLVKEIGDAHRRRRPKWVRREEVPGRGGREGEGDLPRADGEGEQAGQRASTRSSRASSAASTRSSCCSISRSIRDDKVTVSQLVAQASAKTGENIQVSRFVRFRVGEGAE